MTPYWVCAAFTLVSALVSLGYSAAALRGRGDQDARGPEARYAFVRSAVLAILAVVPLVDERPDWLVAAATAMVLVQAGDAFIGATVRDRFKTIGPAMTALVNLCLLLWFMTA